MADAGPAQEPVLAYLAQTFGVLYVAPGSMQIDRKEVEEAGPGSKIGIKTKDRVRPQDVVYRIE